MRTLRLLAPALLLLGPALQAQAPLAKATVDICDPRTLFLQGVAWKPGSTVEIFRLTDPTPENPHGVPVSLGSAPGESDQRQYSLRAAFASPLPAQAELRAVVWDSQGKAVAAADFSTRPRATLQRSAAEREVRSTFEVHSATPLSELPSGFNPGLKLIEMERGKARVHGVTLDHPIQPPACRYNDSHPSLAFSLSQGDRLPTSSVAVRLEGLSDLFGNPVKAEGMLPPIPAPRGKEDAHFYTRLLFESAPGSPEILSLDLKIQPSLQLRGNWLFRPELTASVSRNLPPSTNSIRAAALFSRTDKIDQGVLATNAVSLGPSLEADRGFDRVNGILDLRWKPGVRGLYHPRFKEILDNPQDAPPLTGWGLDGWLGLETGRSIRRQETLGIAPYNILRARPTVHGFYEIGPVTLDVASSLRYLGTRERTPGNVSGFRPYTEVTLSWAFDPAKHLTLAATYRNGSEPPVFVKVEKVSVGVVAKY